MRREQQAGSVALWTGDGTTIVLPLVTDAFWAESDEEDDQHYASCDPTRADMFIVSSAGGTTIFDGPGFRDQAVSFLRALSLYWETRT